MPKLRLLGLVDWPEGEEAAEDGLDAIAELYVIQSKHATWGRVDGD